MPILKESSDSNEQNLHSELNHIVEILAKQILIVRGQVDNKGEKPLDIIEDDLKEAKRFIKRFISTDFGPLNNWEPFSHEKSIINFQAFLSRIDEAAARKIADMLYKRKARLSKASAALPLNTDSSQKESLAGKDKAQIQNMATERTLCNQKPGTHKPDNSVYQIKHNSQHIKESSSSETRTMKGYRSHEAQMKAQYDDLHTSKLESEIPHLLDANQKLQPGHSPEISQKSTTPALSIAKPISSIVVEAQQKMVRNNIDFEIKHRALTEANHSVVMQEASMGKKLFLLENRLSELLATNKSLKVDLLAIENEKNRIIAKKDKEIQELNQNLEKLKKELTQKSEVQAKSTSPKETTGVDTDHRELPAGSNSPSEASLKPASLDLKLPITPQLTIKPQKWIKNP